MLATASVLGALAILVGMVLVRGRIVIVSVAGQSMEPTLAAGDRVLVRRTRLRSVRAGQIVVIEEPGITHNDRTGAPPSHDAGRSWTGDPPRRDLGRSWMIKRVAAVPGDPVPAELAAATGPALAGQAQVPAGKFVVLGDNPEMSMDSRYLGYVPGDRLLGVVVGSLPLRAPGTRAT
jgi:signal peptidase I